LLYIIPPQGQRSRRSSGSHDLFFLFLNSNPLQQQQQQQRHAFIYNLSPHHERHFLFVSLLFFFSYNELLVKTPVSDLSAFLPRTQKRRFYAHYYPPYYSPD
jgi:hypothetical protein